ncbi:phosphatidic acid phosphatase [Spirochaetia bacterium]|nr:phosphatidic acid phosphatase [Spirochaetia bacterium]
MESVIVLTAAEPSLLDAIYNWGLTLIRGIQTIESPGLTEVIQFITSLGTELFYIPAVLVIFWCVDEKKGMRLAMLILLSAWINGTFKALLKQPRPYNLDPSVGRAFEPSYGIPSGHAQGSLVFWAPVAAWLSRKTGKAPANVTERSEGLQAVAVWAVSVLIILLIGFTRLYLGVHFPTDLLAGWLLGGIILTLYFLFESPLAAFFRAGGRRTMMIAAAAVAFLMNIIYPDDISLGGLFLGLGAGYALMLGSFPFSAGAPIKGRKPGPAVMALRLLIGFAGAALLYLGLKNLFPGETSVYYRLGRFIRYGLLSFWAAAGAPWVFLRLGLAGKREA